MPENGEIMEKMSGGETRFLFNCLVNGVIKMDLSKFYIPVFEAGEIRTVSVAEETFFVAREDLGGSDSKDEELEKVMAEETLPRINTESTDISKNKRLELNRRIVSLILKESSGRRQAHFFHRIRLGSFQRRLTVRLDPLPCQPC